MNKKPKVLFIMHMPPPVHGAAMMGQYIYESKAIREKFDCYYLNETISTDVSHVGKFGWYKIKRIWDHSKQIAKMVKEINPNLVYITPSASQPEIGMVRYVFEFIVLNWFKCRKLIHFHNKGDRQKCKNWFFRWYYRILFKNADVMYLSDLLKSQFDWILEPSKIKVCQNGIKETLNEEPSAKRNNQVAKLLFLSNILESKGVIVLMEAVKRLQENGYQLECDFVGAESFDIDTKRFNAETKARGIENIVKYHGKKYGDDKNAYLKQADIFVFPTFYPGECFPLVLLEAMEYKLPLISTNNGAIEEIVHDGLNGFVCKQNDVESLVESIEKLLSDRSLREKMGEESYKIFKQKFTLDKFENRIIDCLEKTLKEK